MSWLEELNQSRVFVYKDIRDPNEVVFGTLEQISKLFKCKVEGQPGETIRWVVDPGNEYSEVQTFEYAGFNPTELNLTTKTTFEKNGRLGVRIKRGDGKVITRSMTREQLLQGKNINVVGSRNKKNEVEVESVLTKGCKEASLKVKKGLIHTRWKKLTEEMNRENYLAQQKAKGRAI